MTQDAQKRELMEKILVDVAVRDFHETLRYLDGYCESTHGFQKLNNLTFQYGDYLINVALKFKLLAHARLLKYITGMNRGICCAPEFVGLYDEMGISHCVLVTRFPGLEGHRLIPFQENRQLCTPEMQRRLIRDIAIFCEIRRIPMALHHTENWYMLPETDTIYFNDFSSLPSIPEADQRRITRLLLEKVRMKLGME